MNPLTFSIAFESIICVFCSAQGSLAWPSTYHLLGDNHEQAAPRAMANCTDLRSSGAGSGLKMDILQWDVQSLPLRTACVDVVVTDLVSILHACAYKYMLYNLFISPYSYPPPTHIHVGALCSAFRKEVSSYTTHLSCVFNFKLPPPPN